MQTGINPIVTKYLKSLSILEKGMRVHVPFGKGNRLIQGIVAGLGGPP